MIHFIIILLLLFTIPLDICFDQGFEQDFKGFLAFFFSMDIIICMNTSYFNRGFIVNERKLILRHYFKNDFFSDILTSIFCLVDLREFGLYSLFKMIFFLRWSFIDLINLIFFSFFILHVFACFWYYIGVVNEEIESNTWLLANNLQEENLTTKYFYAFYWSSVTIMTVGYGDITAKNLKEVIFSSFTVFFGCGLFAYFINSVGGIVKDISRESHIFKSNKI